MSGRGDLEGALPLAGRRVRLEGRGGGEIAIARLAGGSVIGQITLRPGESGLLVVECLRVDEAERGFGAGGEAARLLAALAARAGFRRLEAWAPASSGLAVYFWFRCGFRPRFGERPGGGLAFEREL